jgi:bifunctional DNA-binding transcriptional regulator/antitoxin component of YhaV-PrlF toxin-antitoxin module
MLNKSTFGLDGQMTIPKELREDTERTKDEEVALLSGEDTHKTPNVEPPREKTSVAS